MKESSAARSERSLESGQFPVRLIMMHGRMYHLGIGCYTTSTVHMSLTKIPWAKVI